MNTVPIGSSAMISGFSAAAAGSFDTAPSAAPPAMPAPKRRESSSRASARHGPRTAQRVAQRVERAVDVGEPNVAHVADAEAVGLRTGRGPPR